METVMGKDIGDPRNAALHVTVLIQHKAIVQGEFIGGGIRVERDRQQCEEPRASHPCGDPVKPGSTIVGIVGHQFKVEVRPCVGVGAGGLRMLTIMVQLDAIGFLVQGFAKFPLAGDTEQGDL